MEAVKMENVIAKAPPKLVKLKSIPIEQKLVPSPAYDTFWKFAAERQKIFVKQLQGIGNESSLTNDSILQIHKFTNAYRVCDRVSQYLIRDVIYCDKFDSRSLFLRIILFKLFNKIETWQLLEREFGPITEENFSSEKFSIFLDKQMVSGKRIYSNAYMMASGCRDFKVSRKHQAHLQLLDLMMKNNLPLKIQDSNSMREAYEKILAYPMIGKFLAYQYVTDINYSNLTDFSENEFTMPGPGADDGIAKCFFSTGGYSGADVIKIMTDRQECEFARLKLNFPLLGGRKLHFIDIQNLFCETDKYCRIAHPEIKGISGRTRIKQKYNPNKIPINYFFPPKWNIDMDGIYGSR
ncbi:nucleotide kinase domain-containing protein [Alishewanella sp. HH-ZS]|uniref:nucleotide kinase domain-containing protein n=1 Tax=Alishewanella sp. HH-ZS TaxID=1856684 RepID=UPI001C4004F7|nr:nucleotide kinase domain-containing protein [Alishewanella sp. HH-ZS]